MRMDIVLMVKNEDGPYNVLVRIFTYNTRRYIKLTGSPKPYTTVVYYVFAARSVHNTNLEIRHYIIDTAANRCR